MDRDRDIVRERLGKKDGYNVLNVSVRQFLLGLSSGTHVMCAGVDMIPVKAFRIEPMEGTNGHITVDGEEVDYGPLQAEIFPSLATVMVP